MFISEADILEQDVSLVQIQLFDVTLANTKNQGKARMMCYARSNLPFKLVRIQDSDLEVIALDIGNQRIVGLYKPFKLKEGVKMVDYFNRIMKCLGDLSKTDKIVTVGGDFNVDLNKPSPSLDKLEEWSIQSGLDNLVDKSMITRLRVVTLTDTIRVETSAIDHVYTSDNYFLKLEPSISDHLFLIVESHSRQTADKKVKNWVRDWRAYDKDSARTALSKHLEQISTKTLSVDELTAVFKATLDEIAPMRVVKAKNDCEIISTKVAALQKRRDRYLKKHKKTGDNKHLLLAKSFTYTLKKAVRKEARRIFQCKANSPNPANFWQALNEKMGKFRDPCIELEISGEKISDPAEVSTHFADFFLNKVEKLSTEQVDSRPLSSPQNPITFSDVEIDKAIKSLANKKSFGMDGVSQNLFRDTGDLILPELRMILNSFCQYGLSDNLKIARVMPLHKKGSKIDINNYRPISNLSVFSKVYEKCLLARLDEELPNGEGDHQHGFRKGHSTETALLTIQSILAENLDAGKQGIMYSIDLSAAFDLLRPDKFHDLFKDQLSEGLLFSLMDFLTNRKFMVQLNDCYSQLRCLDRGCVQGSILGPKLFSLYTSKLKSVIETDEISLVSYADDSYVLVVPKEIENVKALAESTIQKHVSFLRSIGMIVNETKTEIMWIGTTPLLDNLSIGNNIVPFTKSMKALGIYVQGDLCWDAQAEHSISKSKKLLSAFRFLRKYLTEKQFLKAASANYYGSVYYAASVWFHNLKQSQKKKLTAVHFRMLRTAKKDFKMALSRSKSTQLCERATPEQWAKFVTASRVIKTIRDQQPAYIFEKLTMNYFEEPRYPGNGCFFDFSRTRKGFQSIQNRLLFMRAIDLDWNNESSVISNDRIRIEMKKTFFPYITTDENLK